MLILYFFVGLFLAAIGGAFPGASNIAVVSTALDGRPQQVKQIAYGAGLGEITLAFLALYYSMIVSDFFEMNPWVKITFVFVFISAGVLFLLKHKLPKKGHSNVKSGSFSERFLKGYAMATLNPPVLLFWLIAIALVHNNYFELSAMLGLPELFLFFAGVFLGKVAILLVYGSTGRRLASKNNAPNGSKGMNRAIGLALISIAVIQGIRLLVI